VFLPAASAFEKGGTFMNGERRLQLETPSDLLKQLVVLGAPR
jgi:predicted molibdopterin-dependent oxidoreductase YjgC